MKKAVHLLSALLTVVMLQAQTPTLELVYNWSDPSMIPSFAFANAYNEVWGFVQDGKEYGVCGSSWGTHIFDLSDPAAIVQVDSVEGAFTGGGVIHRDYHDYGGYLYAVCDEGAGTSTLQIIDLNHLPDSVSVVYDSHDLFTTSHNIFIDTSQARLYSFLTGLNPGFTSIAMYDLSDPELPTLISTYESGTQVHDGYVENNIGYLNDGYNGRVLIMDFSNPINPSVIGSLESYPDRGYNHSGWLHENGETYAFADENHGFVMKVCDVSDPTDIEVVSTFNSEVDVMSIPHNLIFRGDLLFTAHYHDGLYVHDLSDPANPEYVTHYKTYQPTDHESYRGAWGVYPLLPSGLILVSDMQYGFFVFRMPGLVSTGGIDEVSFEVNNVLPNPITDYVNVQVFGNEQEDCQLMLFDLQGRLIQQQTANLLVGQNTFNMQLDAGLAEGLYVLRLEAGNNSFSEQLIKVNR